MKTVSMAFVLLAALSVFTQSNSWAGFPRPAVADVEIARANYTIAAARFNVIRSEFLSLHGAYIERVRHDLPTDLEPLIRAANRLASMLDRATARIEIRPCGPGQLRRCERDEPKANYLMGVKAEWFNDQDLDELNYATQQLRNLENDAKWRMKVLAEYTAGLQQVEAGRELINSWKNKESQQRQSRIDVAKERIKAAEQALREIEQEPSSQPEYYSESVDWGDYTVHFSR